MPASNAHFAVGSLDQLRVDHRWNGTHAATRRALSRTTAPRQAATDAGPTGSALRQEESRELCRSPCRRLRVSVLARLQQAQGRSSDVQLAFGVVAAGAKRRRFRCEDRQRSGHASESVVRVRMSSVRGTVRVLERGTRVAIASCDPARRQAQAGKAATSTRPSTPLLCPLKRPPKTCPELAIDPNSSKHSASDLAGLRALVLCHEHSRPRLAARTKAVREKPRFRGLTRQPDWTPRSGPAAPGAFASVGRSGKPGRIGKRHCG